MKQVSLLFGIHMHQPVDNFDETVQKAVELCYEPFFKIMSAYPAFKFSLHCSGWLLEKIRTEYPKLFHMMQELTQQGSIEWLSGGYYEPVLCSIPTSDVKVQINKLSRYIKKYFKQEPKGLWLTERVWEASLVNILRECGIEYTIVDDYHFISNGYDAKSVDGYYITQNDAQTLSLFAIAKKLRYAVPFSEVSESLDAIVQSVDELNGAAVLFDDAEKFGLWPDTHQWVYEKQWLQKFVEAVIEHPVITTQHYYAYKKNNTPLGLAYLDNCSYEEMGEWSLPTQQVLALKQLKKEQHGYVCKGGIWKHFFNKYAESNYLHKRMLFLSQKKKNFTPTMHDLLYKLQTNDVFWHGAFGGFYLPNLRDNAYRYLLGIEAKRARKKISFKHLELSKDGVDAMLVLTPDLSMAVSAENGAQLVEFGSLDALFNWQNTIMRREEPYHHAVSSLEHTKSSSEVRTIHERKKELNEELENLLVYDWHAKNSFIEHFATEVFTLENFVNLNFHEKGDFANQPFVLKNKKFVRNGGLYMEQKKYSAKLKKSYLFENKAVTLKSKFTTEYEEELYFAQEFNLHFAHPQQVTFNGELIGDGWYAESCKSVVILDKFTDKRLILRSSKECSVFAALTYTVSQSELGFEKIAQQVTLAFSMPFTKAFSFKISMEIAHV